MRLRACVRARAMPQASTWRRFLPQATRDWLFLSPAPANRPTAAGTLLLDPSADLIALFADAGAPFQVEVAASCDLVGAQWTAQGLSVGNAGMALTNALDVVIGTP